LVVLRNKAGTIGHVVIGCAILDAEWDGALSMLPSGEEAASFSEFFCDTPLQASRAMDALCDLGDVPFHPRDFAPKWFSPARGIAAVEWLLAHKNTSKAPSLLTAPVCGELEHVRRVLEAARRPACRFNFVELEPGEDAGFAGPALKNQAESMGLVAPQLSASVSPLQEE
jgi:hypothetical protein